MCVSNYRIYLAIRRGFCPSRMTSNNLISPMKFCYNNNFTLPKQSQRSRSILQDGSRSLGLFWKEKTPSYNRRNTVLLQVLPADPSTSSYEAMKTKFQMYLNDWRDPRDGVNLKCRYFYKASGSEYESVDHKYEPMDKRPIFTLPEGKKIPCFNP